MNGKKDTSALEARLGHGFADRDLLRRALTHSSYSNELRSRGQHIQCNERLEFLGDSVLSLVVSRLIFLSYPDMPEGELSRIRAGAVCEKALSAFAREIDLGAYLWLGKGEENTAGRTRPSILADAFEAVLAATYLDAGERGFEVVSSFLIPFVTCEIEDMLSTGHTEDFKTMLQQVVQQDPREVLEYALISEEGPPHDRRFTVEARLGANTVGRGEGKTKRDAEQLAAREALRLLGLR